MSRCMSSHKPYSTLLFIGITLFLSDLQAIWTMFDWAEVTGECSECVGTGDIRCDELRGWIESRT